jgi:predicted permease
MSPNDRKQLGLLLKIVDAARWLAPASRRREWRRQWRADLWHEWTWAASRERSVAARASVVRRASGAFRHAVALRLHVRRIEMITQDLRYGWRMMTRRPLTTAMAVVTLGLGIGANVVMYSWTRMALVRQMQGVPDADRYVSMNSASRTRDDLSLSFPDYQDFDAHRPASVEGLIVFSLAPMNLRTEGEPQRVYADLVNARFFDILGVRPAIGRGFRPDEDTVANRDTVAVLTYSFWQRRFAGDPRVVGRTITLNGRTFTVIGVTPQGFRGVEPYLNLDLFVPVSMQPAVYGGVNSLTQRGNHWLRALVKLAPGATRATAEADLARVAGDLARAYPDTLTPSVKLWDLWNSPNSGGTAVVGVLGVQSGIAAVVLLIACANVANLLLANAATRHRETAVRLALGASRRRLVQQLLTESTLLALAGGLVGLVAAYWTTDVVRWFVPPAPLPIDLNPTIDGWTVLLAAGVTLVTAVLFGLVPALQSTRASVASTLNESTGSMTAAPPRARLRQALVAAQVAMSLLLLVSASLFFRTLLNSQAVDPGFTARRGVLASVDLLPAGYDEARGRVFFRTLRERVRAIPGVENATFAHRVPLAFNGVGEIIVRVEGYTPAPNEEMLVYWNAVGPEYLKTMGIPLVAGREIVDGDRPDTPDVMVVNEAMVRRYFGGADPIGRRVTIAKRPFQVVGVAGNGKYRSITDGPKPMIYVALDQWYWPDTVLHVRTAGDGGAIVPALQATLRSLDANIALFDVRTIEQHLEVSRFVQRMVASLLAAFGLLALVLATVGLYGVVAALTAQRTPEIGMRMALGASYADILALILKQGFAMTAAGVAAGLVLSLLVTRFYRVLLVGVSTTDAASFLGTTALLVVVALAATILPARRAAAVSPLVALRHD